MATSEEVGDIVAGLLKVPAETLNPATPLNGLLASSMGRARLDATLRSRLGVVSPGVYTVQTFGELCGLAGVQPTDTTSSSPAVKAPSPPLACSDTDVKIGVDIQAVADLPSESDYWEGDFYQQHFTRQEIAYALLQAEPRESFAALWCAKEALRKADSRWMGVDWKLTEVIHDPSGRPALRSGDELIAASVSVSHANGFALAAVVAVQSSVSIPGPALVAQAQPVQEASRESAAPLILSIAALAIALAAAAFSFLR